MYEEIHSAEMGFLVGSSVLSLSRSVKRPLPLRLSGMSVFDVNKVTTCITLLATEALFCNENPDLIGFFLPEIYTLSASHFVDSETPKKTVGEPSSSR